MDWLTAVMLMAQVSPAAPPAANPGTVVVEVKIEQLQEDDSWKQMDARTVFKPGDEIRIRFQSTKSGFVYVLNRSPQGELRRIFPTGETGRMNQIAANQSYTVPASEGSFIIPANPGFDTVFWVLSPTPLVEDIMFRSVPKSGKSTLIPKCDAGTLSARGTCIDPSAGAKAPPKGSGLISRDLTPGGTPESAAVRFVGAQDRVLIYEFWIAHH